MENATVPKPSATIRRRACATRLKLRQVSAGGCNACELELNATANVNFDLQRYGIEWVASPRHADALVLSGALTRTMQDAVRLAWEAMPEPRFVIAVGACAISGGLYDGARGVEIILRYRPDVSLIDVGLPEVDGFEVARRVRADPAGAGLRLVALTGYGLREDRDRTRAAGFDDHAVKPVDADTLLKLVER